MRQSLQMILGTVLLMIGTQAMAQKVSVIPKVGVNISALDAKLEDIRAEARTGWNAGMDFRIGDGFFFLQPGIHYYNFSTDLKKDVGVGEFSDDLTLKEETSIESIRVPLNMGIKILGVTARGGITPSYVTGVREVPGFSFDVDELNRLTMAANVGIGIKILFINLDANYEIGMNDFFKNAVGRNNMLTLSAGIKF